MMFGVKYAVLKYALPLTFFLLIISYSVFSQTESNKLWIYISTSEPKILNKECPKELFTEVFEIEKWKDGYDNYMEKLIEDAFRNSYQFDKHDLVLSTLKVHTYKSVDEAEENLGIAYYDALIKNQPYFSNTADYEKKNRCAPKFIDWSYLAVEKTNLSKIRPLKDGWKQADSTDLSFVTSFIDSVDNRYISTKLMPKIKVTKNRIPWYKAILYEVQILRNDIAKMAFYILRTTNGSFILSSKNELHDHFSKNPPTQMSYNRYLMEYVTLYINSTVSEDGMFKLLTRDNFPIYFEDSEIKPDNLAFEITNPEVVYANEAVSLISAFLHYNQTLFHVIIQVDLVSGIIEMKKGITLKDQVLVPQQIIEDGVFLLPK